MKSTGETSMSRAWFIWFIAALFYGYEFTQRVLPNPLSPYLLEHFNFHAKTLGDVSALYFYAYAFWQIPAGVLMDYWGVKRMLLLAAALVMGGSHLFAIASDINMLKIGRLLIGTGSAFAFVGTLKLARQWLPARRFPLAVGLTNLFGTLGAVFGNTLVPIFILQFSVHQVLNGLTITGLLILAALFCFIKERSHDHQADQAQMPRHSWREYLAAVLADRKTWVFALYATLMVAPIVGFFELWSTHFFTTALGYPYATASHLNSWVFYGIATGGPLIGWLAHRYINASLLARVCSFVSFIVLCVIIYGSIHSKGMLIGLLFVYGIATSSMLLCFSVITHRHTVWSNGLAIGVVNMVIMFGGALYQPAIGWLIDRLQTGEFQDGLPLIAVGQYQLALVVLPVSVLVAHLITYKLNFNPA